MRGLCDHCAHQGAAPSREDGRYSVLAYCVLLMKRCVQTLLEKIVRVRCFPRATPGQPCLKSIVHLTRLRVNSQMYERPSDDCPPLLNTLPRLAIRATARALA